MTAERYTESGDEALERRIGEVIDEIVDRARGAAGLESVLLGGSLGRGEGTVVRDPDGDRLASDVEVYLVGRTSSLRAAARRLERAFAAGAGPEVSAAWLHPDVLRTGRAKNLSWRPSPTIRLYELGAASRTVLGEPPEVYPIDPSSLPLAEGVRLVLNRLAEASPALAVGAPDAGRWTDKILMACGDTVLLAIGAYTARYRDRLARLADVEEPWPMPPHWRATMTSAFERKLGAAPSGDRPADVDEVVLATLGSAVERVTGEPLDPVTSFPQRFTRAGARSHELLRYLPPFGPPAVYEGVVLLTRALRAGQRPGPRAVVQALRGQPLSLALQASALPLYLGIVRTDDRLLSAARMALAWAGLPSGAIAAADGPAGLAQLLYRHWMVAT